MNFFSNNIYVCSKLFPIIHTSREKKIEKQTLNISRQVREWAAIQQRCKGGQGGTRFFEHPKRFDLKFAQNKSAAAIQLQPVFINQHRLYGKQKKYPILFLIYFYTGRKLLN